MKLSTIGLTTAAVALLGVLATPVVHAEEVTDQAKDTQTQVKIIDNNGSANLLLKKVPELFEFKTKLDPNGEYKLNGHGIGVDSIIVFNDKFSQDWSVRASLLDTELRSKNDDKRVTVTSFKLNDQELMGQHANQIVHKSNSDKTVKNNTGDIIKEIPDLDLSVAFNDELSELTVGDILEGTVHYQLFNTPDAK